MDTKRYYLLTYIFLIAGIILFFAGIIKYFFRTPYSTYNLKTLLPTISDGSLMLITGAGAILVGIYRMVYKRKIIQNELELERKKKKKDEKRERKYGIKPW